MRGDPSSRRNEGEFQLALTCSREGYQPLAARAPPRKRQHALEASLDMAILISLAARGRNKRENTTLHILFQCCVALRLSAACFWIICCMLDRLCLWSLKQCALCGVSRLFIHARPKKRARHASSMCCALLSLSKVVLPGYVRHATRVSC